MDGHIQHAAAGTQHRDAREHKQHLDVLPTVSVLSKLTTNVLILGPEVLREHRAGVGVGLGAVGVKHAASRCHCSPAAPPSHCPQDGDGGQFCLFGDKCNVLLLFLSLFFSSDESAV